MTRVRTVALLSRFDRRVLGRTLGGLHARLRVDQGNAEGCWPEYQADPVGFARHILGVRLWSAQKKALLSIRDHKSTAIASAHGIGKSFLAAVACLWWMCTRRPARVFITAPTHRQVTTVTFMQIARLHRAAKQRLPGKVLSAMWKVGTDRLATGASGRNPDAVQGVHSQSVLIIMDEASGVPDEIKAALDGAMTADDSRELAIGNPTGQAGFFRNAFLGKSRTTWNAISISALRTPNVRSGRTLIPGLVDREWVERVAAVYGTDSPYYKNRVLGQFVAAEAGERVVPEAWVEAAQQRWGALPVVPVDLLAVDIARSGEDSTAIVALAGRRLYTVETMHVADLMAIANRIIEVANELRPRAIHCDSTGLGVGVTDRLMQQQHLLPAGTDVVDVVLGRRSSNGEVWPRLLDELQWAMRTAMDPSNPEAIGIDPDDSEMAKQLSQRTWRLDDRSRIVVETKSRMKARGASSPDVADAAMMCFHKTVEISVSFF